MTFTKNILQGRIAESLVEELLRSAGNHVYRFGYEFVFQNIRVVADLNNEIGSHIKTFPDFLVITEKGKPYFVEVKFRREPEWWSNNDDNKLKRLNEFWKPRIILVNCSQRPYFRITEPPCYNPYIDKDKESPARPLDEYEEFNIKSLGEKKLKDFDDLIIEKYLSA